MERELDKLIKRLQLTVEQGDKIKKAFSDLAGPELSRAIAAFEALVKNGVDTEKAMKDAAAAGKELGDNIGYAFGEAVSLYEQLKDIAKELNQQEDATKKINKSFSKIVDVGRQLAYDAQDIVDLNMREINQLQEKYKIQQQIFREGVDELLTSDEIGKSNENLIRSLEKQVRLKNLSLDSAFSQLDAAEGLTEEQKELVKNFIAGFKPLDEINEKILAREQLERNINKNMGVTGALVQGTGALMERLGMRSGIFHQAMSDAAAEMRKMAKAAGDNVTFMKQLQIAAKGFSVLVKGFGQALFDPAVIIGKIVEGFFKIDSASTKLQQLTGQNSTALAGFNNRLATSVDVLEVMVELTQQTGMNAQNIFSPDVLAGAAELKNTLGLAADEAGGLAKITQSTSGDIDKVTESIVDTTSAFNETNKTAISQGQIIRDVGKASDAVSASFAGQPKLLAKSAAAARRLGMDLQKLDDIASSLLDFESSIQAELEAQLLTGRDLNLSKARELALMNQLDKVGQELFKNSVSLNEFGEMNRIQQEAQAKALGMSRDELAKIAYNRALELNMTKEQAAAAAGVSLEEMKRMAVQEKLAKAADKLAQAFSPMLDILIPIADLVGMIVKPIASIVAGLMKLADSIKGTEESATSFRNIIASIVKLLTGAGIIGSIALIRQSLIQAFNPKIPGKFFDRIKENIKNIFKKGKLKETIQNTLVPDPSKGKGSKLSEVSKKIPKGKDGITSTTSSISKINTTALLKGAAAMAVAAGAIFIFGKAIQELEKVEDYGKVAQGLLAFGVTMGVLGGLLTLAAPALAAASAGLIPFGASIALIGAGAALGALAFKLLADSMGTMLDAVQGRVGTLAKLGLALIPLSVGIGALGTAGISSAPGIFLLAGSLAAFATSALLAAKAANALKAVFGSGDSLEFKNSNEDVKKVDISPIQPKVALAEGGIVQKPTNALVGEAGAEAVIPLKEFYAKMDKLISVVQKGGDVYMDGNKVGQSLMLAKTKLN